MKKSDKFTIIYMIELCDDVYYLKERFGDSYDDLIVDKAYQLAVSMVIVNLGESVTKLSEEYLEEHSEIPWREIVGMRNIFAHNYLGINFTELWDTIEYDIPELKDSLNNLLNEFEDS